MLKVLAMALVNHKEQAVSVQVQGRQQYHVHMDVSATTLRRRYAQADVHSSSQMLSLPKYSAVIA